MAREDISRKSFSSASALVDVEDEGTLLGEDGISISNNDGRTRLLLISAGSGAADVVIPTPTTYDTDLTLEDREVNVPDNQMVLIGPFSPAFYNQPDGKLHVDPKAVGDYDSVIVVPFI